MSPMESKPDRGREERRVVPEKDASRIIESLTRNLLESYEELDLLHRVAGRLASNLDVQQNVELVLAEAVEILDADLGWVYPVDPASELFRPRRKGISPRAVEILRDRVRYDLRRGGRARVFENLRSRPDLEGTDPPDSLLCATLAANGTVFGVLCVGRRGERTFTAGDGKLAHALASSAAMALENHRLNLARLEQERAEIRRRDEMRLAHDIQTHLLPRTVPALAGYDIAGRSLPARGVGGDYFDIVPVGEGRAALCLGDVCGKGVPAALLMANLQASIRGQTLLGASPAACLAQTNRLLCESTDPEKFVTCFYGILDARENHLHYANAGHERPLLVSAEGEYVALDPGGLVLGVEPGETYPEACVDIQPGEVFVLYSDGITEAWNEDEEEFGLERLVDVLAAHRKAAAADVLEAVLTAVEAHAGDAPVSDDRTLVVVRRDPA